MAGVVVAPCERDSFQLLLILFLLFVIGVMGEREKVPHETKFVPETPDVYVNKKMKTGFALEGMSSSSDEFDFIGATRTTNHQMPSLIGTPSSSSDSSVDNLQEAQNREVAGNVTAC